jgi:murein L,D-transpeptidase YcbB/YkuD
MRVGNLTFAKKRHLSILTGAAAMLASGVAFANAPQIGVSAPGAGAWSSSMPPMISARRADATSAESAPSASSAVPAIVSLSKGEISFALTAQAGREPLAEAVRARSEASLSGARAVERRAERKAIATVYAARDYAPLWSDGGTWSVAAIEAMQQLRQAEQDGLDLRAYRLPDSDRPTLQDELDLSEAVLAYAFQASGARVDPQNISRLIGMRPTLPEADAVLAAVSGGGERAGEILQDFNPRHSGYVALKAKLAELRAARSGGERMAELQNVANGQTVTDGAPHAPLAGHAPEMLGRVEAEIIANMERWRWMPRELSATRIEVNIPDFELSLTRDNVVAYRSRVIVGKTSTPTPIFSNAMRTIVVNPYWNVPPSILKNEMLAKHGGDLSYLTRRGFDVSYQNGRPSVRQRPGERNALGRIKFLFPNEYSVYMHDTPTRGLFAKTYRAFSHGCVRVDQPFRLAEAVLGPDSGWSEERVRSLLGSSERTIGLAQPLPVHIEYFTAFVDENGALQLRDDLYGYSAKVRKALGMRES